MTDIVVGSLVVFVASCTQIVTGFGFALLAVPILSFFFPTQSVVVLVVIYSLVANFLVLKQTKSDLKLSEIRWLVLFSAVGIPFGVAFLKVADPNVLKVIVGTVVFGTAIAMMTGAKVRIGNELMSSGIAGLLSGFLNGSISMSGPPVVLFLTNRGDAKDRFRANLAAWAAVINAITIVSLWISGVLNRKVLPTLEYLAPSFVVGIAIGTLVVGKVNDQVFRWIVLALVLIAGAVAAITSVSRLL